MNTNLQAFSIFLFLLLSIQVWGQPYYSSSGRKYFHGDTSDLIKTKLFKQLGVQMVTGRLTAQYDSEERPVLSIGQEAHPIRQWMFLIGFTSEGLRAYDTLEDEDSTNAPTDWLESYDQIWGLPQSNWDTASHKLMEGHPFGKYYHYNQQGELIEQIGHQDYHLSHEITVRGRDANGDSTETEYLTYYNTDGSLNGYEIWGDTYDDKEENTLFYCFEQIDGTDRMDTTMLWKTTVLNDSTTEDIDLWIWEGDTTDEDSYATRTINISNLQGQVQRSYVYDLLGRDSLQTTFYQDYDTIGKEIHYVAMTYWGSTRDSLLQVEDYHSIPEENGWHSITYKDESRKEIISKSIQKRDNQDRVIHYEWQYESDGVAKKTLYNYNLKGQLTEKTIYTDDELSDQIVHIYNRKGLLIQKRHHYKPDGYVYIWDYDYTYQKR